MGMRLGILFVSTQPAGYFGTAPTFDSSRIGRVCGLLGYRKVRRIKNVQIYDVLNPEGNEFALGIYDGGLFYAAENILDSNLLDVFGKLKERLLIDYPNAETLVVQTSDVVNLFGYALYHGAELIRAFSGDGDNGITVDIGPLQPEEKPAFERSKKILGERFFFDPRMPLIPFKVTSYGGNLAEAMMVRFLGRQLFSTDSELDLHIELFESEA